MTTSDFKTIDEFGEWLRIRSLAEFKFLIHDHGFEVVKDTITARQFSVEYQKDELDVGLWVEYGTRPEIFIKSKGKRVFTNQLISKYARGLKLPVKPAVFGNRTMKDDYRNILDAYANLVKACLDAESFP
jgi:hypothetical protein